ncbi:MAG: GAF domain-containing protein [Planctomycetes bacterium]|nr:GAF domain-containing protein [Planctomycetota bacterium]
MNTVQTRSAAEVTRQLAAARVREDVASVVFHAAREWSGADHVVFAWREGGGFVPVLEEGGSAFPAVSELARWCVEHRQPLAIEDVRRDPRCATEPCREGVIRGLLMLPLCGGGGCGVVSMHWVTPHQSGLEEIEALAALTEAAALALENVRLREETERHGAWLRFTSDRLPAICWTTDVHLRFTSGVGTGLLELPVKSGRLLGKTLAEFFGTTDPDFRPIAAHRRALAGESVTYEAEWFGRAYHSRVEPLRDALGHVVGTIGVAMDITDRRRLLEQAASERSRLEAVLRQMPAGVIIAEAPSGKLVLSNDEVARIWRHPWLPAASIAEYTQYKGFHPDGRPYEPQEWPLARAVTKGELVVGEEITYQRGDGTRGVMLANAAPVRDANGRILSGVVTFWDVTLRKQTEDAHRFLAEATSLLSASLDTETTLSNVAKLAVPHIADWCAVYLVRDDGSLARVAVVHEEPQQAEALEEMLQAHPLAEEFDHGIKQVLRMGRPDLVAEVTDDLLVRAAPNEEVLRLLRACRFRSYMSVPIMLRDRPVGVITLVSSTSARVFGPADVALAEELARRVGLAIENARLYQKAQEAIRVREEFLGIASHELKTPLAALQLTLEGIKRLWQKGQCDVLLSRIEAAQQQGRRLAKLIHSLLDVSRMVAGRFTLERQEVDLTEIVKEVLDRFEGEFSAKGLKVERRLGSAVVGTWDPLQIEQVVMNLVSNAIKYGEGKPFIVAVESDDRSAFVSVQDQGIGMSEEFLRRLFRPFERGVQPGRYGGLGLGLYISRSIVEAHGGAIEVQSARGKGSTFRVRLPR